MTAEVLPKPLFAPTQNSSLYTVSSTTLFPISFFLFSSKVHNSPQLTNQDIGRLSKSHCDSFFFSKLLSPNKKLSMALFSPPIPPTTLFTAISPIQTLSFKPQLTLLLKKTTPSSFLFITKSSDNGSGVVGSVVVVEKVEEEEEEEEEGLDSNEVAAAVEAEAALIPAFKDPRWIGGTWDLKQFDKEDGKTDWDAVIDAEARRRKWLEDNPEASNNYEPIIFDTSIIPWWAWIKRFHLPEAELLNGRAAMVGFFMAYFVDSLTGVGLVDQMGNFFCKTLLFVAVSGVLLIRKNEDIETLKKLIDETTFYDKQWRATWQDDDAKKK